MSTTLEQTWAESRGKTGVPTFWTCTGCGYAYWSYGNEQDPNGDGHCSEGKWLADARAIWETPTPKRDQSTNGN